MNTTHITVRFQKEGMHRWPNAPEHRWYLARGHRHMFHWEVSLGVKHGDREVEFHDFLDFASGVAPSGNLGTQSCETLAVRALEKIQKEYPDRYVSVAVFEDGEVGAVVATPEV